MLHFINHTGNWLRKNVELLAWCTGMIALFMMDAEKPQASLCFFSWIGFSECPGCGIGHSIHYALHFDLSNSFRHHILGIPAVIIIFMRIKRLLHPPKNVYEAKSCQPDTIH